MQHRRYGTNGPMVSPVAYGALSITQDPGLRDSVAPSLLDALERGVNLIDTARIYPESENIVAATLAQWRGDRPLISTKLRSKRMDGFRWPGPVCEYYDDQAMRASVDESLRALRIDHIDIIHLHQWHYRWTHEDSWRDAIGDLQREGKVGLVAVSAQDHEHDAVLELVSQGRVDGVQAIVNLFESRPFNSLLPLAQDRGVGVIARCVLDSGGLTGQLSAADMVARPFLRAAPTEVYQDRLSAIMADFVPAVAGSLVELAVRFAASHPAVSSITMGMVDTGQVDAAIAAVEAGALDDSVIADICRKHVWTKNFYERL